MEVRELVGVYDADATLWGEMSYWIGARLGWRHCSLCDITHGLFAEKSAWQACVSTLPVPFTTYHRNDQPDDVRACIGDQLPAIVARYEHGVEQLVGPAQLAACRADPNELLRLLQSLLAQR
jgi:hypothetical protein